MRRRLLGCLAVGWLLLLGGAANAALVSTDIVLRVSILDLAPITISSAASVSVMGSSVSVIAGAVALSTPAVVPLTATTTIFSLSATKLSNLAGTFSLGGVSAQVPGEICGAGPSAGQACNVGGGFGGRMGMTGSIRLHILPGIVAIPIHLGVARVGQGGATNSPFTIDAAAWTSRTGLANTGNDIVSLVGTGAPLTLVTPTYVLALGNLLPIFSTLTFTNVSIAVPEPGVLLLLVAGVAGIGMLVQQRR